jgi:hypothetical protein
MSNKFVSTLEKVKDDVRKYCSGPLPSADTKPYGEAYRDFFWPYDVFAKAPRGMKIICRWTC